MMVSLFMPYILQKCFLIFGVQLLGHISQALVLLSIQILFTATNEDCYITVSRLMEAQPVMNYQYDMHLHFIYLDIAYLSANGKYHCSNNDLVECDRLVIHKHTWEIW